MKKLKDVFRCVAVLPVVCVLVSGSASFSAYADDVAEEKYEPQKCTAVYVGKDVSDDGTMMIARSEDQYYGVWGKTFYVVPASEGKNQKLTETGIDNPLSVDIPDETYRYTVLYDDNKDSIGPYYASCVNEYGLGVTATVSTEVSKEYEDIDPLKQENEGIHEAIFAAIPACQCKTAEDAVDTMAEYIDKYGSAEWNTVLVSDKNEAWIFEIYGGTSYAAMRLPADKVAVFGNQIMLDWVDFNETDGFVYSDNLKKNLDKLSTVTKDSNGRYHLAKSISGNMRYSYSNMRTWRGHQLLAPSNTGDFNNDTFYSLLFDPDEKVSVFDVMELLGDRYEGTKYDMENSYNEDKRPIGVTRASFVSIIQTWDTMPENCCQLQWLALGNAEHCIFVPAFCGITDTYEKYKVSGNNEEFCDSFYYVSRRNASIAETDREYLGDGLKEFNLAQEKLMYNEIKENIEDIKSAYEKSDEDGEKFVTELGISMAETQYNNMISVYNRLQYVQMYNMNDGKDKIKFTADSVNLKTTEELAETEKENVNVFLILFIISIMFAGTEFIYIMKKTKKRPKKKVI